MENPVDEARQRLYASLRRLGRHCNTFSSCPIAMIETTCQSPDSPVHVSFANGAIRVEAPALFASPDDATIHTLVERLFHVHAVKTVVVDREHAAIDIQYDGFVFDTQTALRTLSAHLVACDGPLE